MLRFRRLRLVPIAAALSGALLLAGGGLVLAADGSVSIENLTFSPGTVTVNVGDSVTWTNNDNVSHTATANDDSWDTGTLNQGGSESITFDTAGEFPYHCEVHSEMTGTVVVEAAGGGGTAAPTAAPTNPQTDTAPGGPSEPSATLLAGVLAFLAAAILGAAFLVDRRLERN